MSASLRCMCPYHFRRCALACRTTDYSPSIFLNLWFISLPYKLPHLSSDYIYLYNNSYLKKSQVFLIYWLLYHNFFNFIQADVFILAFLFFIFEYSRLYFPVVFSCNYFTQIQEVVHLFKLLFSYLYWEERSLLEFLYL